MCGIYFIFVKVKVDMLGDFLQICWIRWSVITCVIALAFQSPNKGPFEAQYKCQSSLFEIWFNKLLLEKSYFSTTIGGRGSIEVSKWWMGERALSLRFLKEGPCFGCCYVGFVGFYGLKGVLGPQKHVDEVSGVCQENWRFAKKLCAAYSFKSAFCSPRVSKSRR